MAYFVLCTFDLEGAEQGDYDSAYDALEEIGLLKDVEGSNSLVNLPNTVTVGEFTGTSSQNVKTYIADKVQKAFEKLRLKSKIFITVSERPCWSYKVTK